MEGHGHQRRTAGQIALHHCASQFNRSVWLFVCLCVYMNVDKS